jgi:hypothetical protein
MKSSLCLALLGLFCCGFALAQEAPSIAPAAEPLPFLAPSCGATAQSTAALPSELLLPATRQAASCTVSVLCRCGQRLSCTSAAGNCQRVLGCSVTCDGNEQVCPPCNGFACF